MMESLLTRSTPIKFVCTIQSWSSKATKLNTTTATDPSCSHLTTAIFQWIKTTRIMQPNKSYLITLAKMCSAVSLKAITLVSCAMVRREQAKHTPWWEIQQMTKVAWHREYAKICLNVSSNLTVTLLPCVVKLW